tara:strand:+ start:2223 stop:2399 length:177 start_codon:yes stop_codon:yes gene_type:complete
LPDKEYKEGLASFKAWLKENKKLEKMGLYGTDHFIKEVEKLQAKVRRLEAKLKRKGKK